MALVAAVAQVVCALELWATPLPQAAIDAEAAAAVTLAHNRQFMSFFARGTGVGGGLMAAMLGGGGARARRWCVGVVGVAAVGNLVGLALQVVGMALVVNEVLLVIVVWLVAAPSGASGGVAERWWGRV